MSSKSVALTSAVKYRPGISAKATPAETKNPNTNNINTNIFLKNILFIALIIRLQKTNVNLTLVYFASN